GLHMDPMPPTPSMDSLQKNSPHSDPATTPTPTASSSEPPTVHQITTELSAQASTLFAHQQQLDRLTDLTAQLVRAFTSRYHRFLLRRLPYHPLLSLSPLAR
ncbi:hypothetical protein M9458_008187, partial [Cirrhinus mrigala]